MLGEKPKATASVLRSGVIRAHAIRLTPGTDFVSGITYAANEAMAESRSSAAFVLSAVGSLECARLRMANACKTGGGGDGGGTTEVREWNERLEVVSLVGTIGPEGKHLHMSVSDAVGKVWGGHVMSGRVFTTLELVLGTIQNVGFKRRIDDATGYRELAVEFSSDGRTRPTRQGRPAAAGSLQQIGGTRVTNNNAKHQGALPRSLTEEEIVAAGQKRLRQLCRECGLSSHAPITEGLRDRLRKHYNLK